MNGLSTQERSCLLRAARKYMENLADEVQRLHDIGAVDEYVAERAVADVKSLELECLASAVRKLWLASKGLEPP